jgi:hypothetical protein
LEQLGCQQTDFLDISNPNICKKSVDKVEVSLKSGKKNDYMYGGGGGAAKSLARPTS